MIKLAWFPDHHCTIKEPLQRVNESIRMLLFNITLADLTEPAGGPTGTS